MKMFPQAPTSAINWHNIASTGIDVNGHIESTWHSATQGWSAPVFISDPYLRLHGLSPCLNYGAQVFEGMKAHRDANGDISIFRPERHAARINHSAQMASMPFLPPSHFLACVQAAVALNSEFVPPHSSSAFLYIRPLILSTGEQIGLVPSDDYTLCVYVKPNGAYHGTRALDALILEDFDRAAPRGTGSAKLGGKYAPVNKFQAAARKKGFQITLHLDSKTQTEIDEFSTSAFLGNSDGVRE